MSARVKYHGRGYRRTVVVFLGLGVVVWLVGAHPLAGVTAGQAVLRLALGALAVAASYLWFGVWPGIRWDDRGMTLVSVLHWRRIQWSDVARLEWERYGSMGQRLAIYTRAGSRTRVPTVMKVDGTDWGARFWESDLLRGGSQEPREAKEALMAQLNSGASRPPAS